MTDAVTLERRVLQELLSDWKNLSYEHFASVMRPPLFELSDSDETLGQWVSEQRTIRMSRRLVLDEPWGVVMEVLKHEMAHQFVDEVLNKRDEAAHGPAFRRVCEDAGINASAYGLPAGSQEDRPEVTRTLRRVERLLALAESPNEAEAQAAMDAAQRLMLKHNVDQAEIRSGTDNAGLTYRFLGEPTARLMEWQRTLGAILTSFFFVEGIWVSVYRPRAQKYGRVLEISGRTENVEMAEYVHGYLSETAKRLWAQHKLAEGIEGNRDRMRYFAGVMRGFYDKLKTQARAHQKEGLVWAGDPTVERYYRRRHPRTQTMRRTQATPTAVYAQGQEAGRGIVLHRPVESTEGSRGRLLGPGHE